MERHTSLLGVLKENLDKFHESERIIQENINSILKIKNNILLVLDNLEKQRQEFIPGNYKVPREVAQNVVEIVQQYKDFCAASERINSQNSEKYREEMEHVFKRHVGFFRRIKAIQDHINNLESAARLQRQNSGSESPQSPSENPESSLST